MIAAFVFTAQIARQHIRLWRPPTEKNGMVGINRREVEARRVIINL